MNPEDRQVIEDIENAERNLRSSETENRRSQSQLDSYNPLKEENRTRASLARVFVYSFFFILVMILVLVPLYNYLVVSDDAAELTLNLNDLLLTYSSVVGPILGFVVGYYFKTRGDS